jgi:TolA-binding protein
MFRKNALPYALLLALLCRVAHGDSAAAAYRQAYACLASNRLVEAAALFSAATASTNPATAAAAWLGRGEALYGAKKWPDAIDAYGRLLADYPDSPLAPNALCSRGFAEFQAGQLPQAQATLAAFAARYPAHALAARAIASTGTISRALAAQSRQREAEAISRELAAIRALSREPRPAEAAEASRRFLQAHPSHPQAADLRYLAAACLRLAKDDARCADAYRDFLARHPGHPQAPHARLELGNALAALGRFAEAADAYAEAAGAQAEAEPLRADCLFKAARFEEALPLLEKQARSAADPRQKARATLQAGACYAALKNWPKAERAFHDVELFCDDEALRPVALARLADLYDKTNRPDQAASARSELKRRFPDWK